MPLKQKIEKAAGIDVETLAALLMAGEIFKKHIKENELVAVVERNCKAARLIKEYFKNESGQD